MEPGSEGGSGRELSLVVVEDGAPCLPQVGSRAGLAIDAGQSILPVLPGHELHLHPNITTLTATEIQRLRIDIQKVPVGE